MKSQKRQSSSTGFLVATIVGVAVTLITGVAAGYFSQRWGPSGAIEAYATQLATMPRQFGDWQMIEEKEMSETAVQILKCQEYVNRVYRNETTGQQVSIAVTLGPTGPIAVHTPEVCYSSREYAIRADRRAVTITENEDHAHTFWRVDFTANNPLRAGLRVHYGWTAGGTWLASESPRYEFATSRALFKLQLASSELTDSDTPESDAGRRFLNDLFDTGWTVTGNKTAQQSDNTTADG